VKSAGTTGDNFLKKAEKMALFTPPQKPTEEIAAAGPAFAPSNESFLKAAQDGSIERIRFALSQGIDVNATGAGGETALMSAAGYGQEETVKFLLAGGADVSMKDKGGRTALDISEQNSRPAIVQILKNAMSREDIFEMIRRFHPERVQALLRLGADPNKKSDIGETPLMEASAYGYTEIVQILLEGGANKNLTNRSGQTALDIARISQREEVIALLEGTQPEKTPEPSAA
jgi:ankyrin repeat protein